MVACKVKVERTNFLHAVNYNFKKHVEIYYYVMPQTLHSEHGFVYVISTPKLVDNYMFYNLQLQEHNHQ